MVNLIVAQVWRFENEVDTNVIIQEKSMRTNDIQDFIAHLTKDIAQRFIKKVKQGDIIVARTNLDFDFSREQDPLFEILRSGLRYSKVFCKKLF